MAEPGLEVERHGEPATRVAVAERALGPGDLERVWALHRLTMAHVPPEVVKAETREFFAGLLAGRGRLIGLFDGDHMIAYAVLQTDLTGEEDPHDELGLAPEIRIAKLAGAAVEPAFRGNHLQQHLIGRRLVLAREAGYDQAYATASPFNAYSWRNLVDRGLSIAALKHRYGGLLRYIVHSELNRPLPAPDWQVECAPENLVRQVELLGRGARGIAWRDTPGGVLIRYHGWGAPPP